MAILNALNFNVWTFLLQIVNLLVVIAILNKLLYQPVAKIMREREAQIEGSISEANRAQKDAEKLLAEYEEKMQTAKKEAQEIVSRADKMGEDMRQKMVSDAREESTRTLAKAKEEIAGEKAKALAEIRDEVATLAMLAAGKVVGRAIDDEDQRKLVEEFVSEVGELQ
ncbi:F0F1 ATP synthase subunit B [Metallumcola ferriviriculae]|uniref:ATP synthase subunit b n=1 Tax=Metallumcola ferriviriculae TaxID=3039180 RepID=A0AAU0UJY4_9FIRM|nr:F0F1 ATP synthase subunit B [Desulfitibacteraceae bacterium MK1]